MFIADDVPLGLLTGVADGMDGQQRRLPRINRRRRAVNDMHTGVYNVQS